ncbi:sodium-dependent serotonin transporter [Platysternon megacephalum]|uniref:Sodium-dependent serotonin transporter n=1 Tax=Platysternon megacephalum TaxID=55544 RepID=A0A4D9E0V6_9SAUR|nr:sodium-dependent serotonin transporter [Platysternon megacephalum]
MYGCSAVAWSQPKGSDTRHPSCCQGVWKVGVAGASLHYAEPQLCSQPLEAIAVWPNLQQPPDCSEYSIGPGSAQSPQDLMHALGTGFGDLAHSLALGVYCS